MHNMQFVLQENMVRIVAIVARIPCTDSCVKSTANVAEICVITFMGVVDRQQVEYFSSNFSFEKRKVFP